jgi:hypothetical protein
VGFVKRKGTKAVKHLSEDFENISKAFTQKITNVIHEHNLPGSFIIHWDSTGCQLVHGGDWTMEKEGNQQFSIKRQTPDYSSAGSDQRRFSLATTTNLPRQSRPPLTQRDYRATGTLS